MGTSNIEHRTLNIELRAFRRSMFDVHCSMFSEGKAQ